MNKKIATEVALGIILIVAVVIGGFFWLENKKQITQPVSPLTPTANVSSETKKKVTSKEDLLAILKSRHGLECHLESKNPPYTIIMITDGRRSSYKSEYSQPEKQKTTINIIDDGVWKYNWSDMVGYTNTKTKSQESYNNPEGKDISPSLNLDVYLKNSGSCKSYDIQDSDFLPPKNIEFKDYTDDTGVNTF